MTRKSAETVGADIYFRVRDRLWESSSSSLWSFLYWNVWNPIQTRISGFESDRIRRELRR